MRKEKIGAVKAQLKNFLESGNFVSKIFCAEKSDDNANSKSSEVFFLFIRLLLTDSVSFETYHSKPTVGGRIKKCGKIERFNPIIKILHLISFLVSAY